MSFNALTLLVGLQGQLSACRKLSDEVLVCLFVWSEVQMICINGPADATATPSYLHWNANWFNLSGDSLPMLSLKRGR